VIPFDLIDTSIWPLLADINPCHHYIETSFVDQSLKFVCPSRIISVHVRLFSPQFCGVASQEVLVRAARFDARHLLDIRSSFRWATRIGPAIRDTSTLTPPGAQRLVVPLSGDQVAQSRAREGVSRRSTVSWSRSRKAKGLALAAQAAMKGGS
jgi:hypothetical protein